MKIGLHTIGLSALVSFSAGPGHTGIDLDPPKGLIDTVLGHMQNEEIEMLLAINEMRTDPAAYREYVLCRYQDMLSDSVSLSGSVSQVIKTRWSYTDDGIVQAVDTVLHDHFSEKKKAFLDLINELEHTDPLPPLMPSLELHHVAAAHARDQAPNNYVQHWDSRGRWPEERIKASISWVEAANENIAAGPGGPEDILLQLMVDCGVDGYGHRKNLLDPDWRFATCVKVNAISHGQVSWWIQEFAR